MKSVSQSVAAHVGLYRYPYIALAVILLFNIGTLIELVSDWYRDDNYSHGFFIIPISIYLFYRKREELSFPAKTSRSGLVLLALGCLGLVLGVAASEYFTTRFSLVMIVSGLALFYLGGKNFRKVWFAFFFLLFMIPIPAVIYYAATLPMQLFASKVTAGLLHVIGVPAMRSGNIINLPEYSLEVAEACSGLRSLVTLLALGALYACHRMPGKVLPVILFVATIPIAIATNIVRIFVTAIGAYAISIEVAESFLHEMSGLIVFVTALIMMAIFGSILVWIRNRLV